MAKKGMARPDWTHTQPKNDAPPVPEIQGRAKHKKAQSSSPAEGFTQQAQRTFQQLSDRNAPNQSR